jgi:hypothetical protein
VEGGAAFSFIGAASANDIGDGEKGEGGERKNDDEITTSSPFSSIIATGPLLINLPPVAGVVDGIPSEKCGDNQ